ncbi:MAG: murein transglycosylase domain-containing protein [Bacteroidota bacterium]|nr:murein transglycosylase domain-containing protein [Bacteroidota bacterium]
MKKIFVGLKLFSVVVVLIIFSNSVIAQEPDKKKDLFGDFKKKQEKSFNLYKENSEKMFDEYEKAEKEAFNKFKERIEKLWGADDFKESTKESWVEYSEDNKTRTDVDFEKGEATIEVLVTPEEVKDENIVKKKVQKAVEELVASQGNTKDYNTSVEEKKPLSKKPILEDQLVNKKGDKIDASNSKEYAKEMVESKPITSTIVKGKDNKERVKVEVTLNLAPNNIRVRANKILKLVDEYSEKYNLHKELVFAIIHTESYFNPKAKSHVPAFGLMQLVPRYAGRDAYKFVYKEDKFLSGNYLYVPTQNIELGTAYFHILLTRSFRKVKNPKSRLYCAIAAYNTGAGNVSRAFIGTTKLYSAIPEINKLNPEQVYGHLRKNLPYDETKDYLKKVTARMVTYKQWMK